MRNLKLRYLLFSNYLNLLGYGLFLPLYAIFVLHVGGRAFDAATTLGIYSLASGIFIVLFGRLEDTHYNKKLMIVMGYFMLAFGGLLFLFVRDITELYLVQIFNAFAVGMLYPAWKSVYAACEDKGKEGFEWGLFDGGNQIITAIAAFIGGIIISISSFNYIFMLMFIIQLIAAIISLQIFNKASTGIQKSSG